MAAPPRGSHSSVSLIQLPPPLPPLPVQVPTPHLSLIPRVAGESLTLARSLPLFSKCHASRESFCKSDSSAPEADETPGRRGKGRVSPGALVAAAAAARTGRNCYVRGTFTVTVPYKLSWAEWVARDTLHVSGLYKYLDALLCTYNAPAFHRRRFQASRHRYQDSLHLSMRLRAFGVLYLASARNSLTQLGSELESPRSLFAL